MSSLTLYFQISGINLKINENEESNSNEPNTPKDKRSSAKRELERLQMDSKVFNYDALRKRDKKPVKSSVKSDGRFGRLEWKPF